MSAQSPRIRFFIITGISVIIIISFSWYNYGILGEVKEAKKIISGLDKELRVENQVRKSIIDAQRSRGEKVSDLGKDVIHSLREYELDAVKMRNLAKKYDIKVLGLNLRPVDTFPPINKHAKVKKVPLERQRIAIKLNGEFLNIGPFFDAVEKQIKSVNLHSYKFSLDSNAATKVIADVVYYTYRMEKESL